MASATYNYGFPYPTNSDNVDIPGDIEALAEAVDLKVLSIDADITTLQDTSAYSAQVSASIDTAINEYDAQVSASMVVQNSNVSASMVAQNNNVSASISNIFNGPRTLGTLNLYPSASAIGSINLISPTLNENASITVSRGGSYVDIYPEYITINSVTQEIGAEGPPLSMFGEYPSLSMYSTLYGGSISSHLQTSSSVILYDPVLDIHGGIQIQSASAVEAYNLGGIAVNPITDSASAKYGGELAFYVYEKNVFNTPTVVMTMTSSSVQMITPLYGTTINLSGTAYASALETTNYAVFGTNIQYKNAIAGYTTTATSAGTLTLSASSNYQQFLTGTTTHTVVLPVAATMNLGQSYLIHNNSTGIVTVNSSGGNAVIGLVGGTSAIVTCILTSGTTAASWDAKVSGIKDRTGSGSLVLSTNPTLITPVLGTPQSVTLTNGTGLPISTGVSGLGTGVATFLATPTSANFATALTGETGSGSVVFSASPTLTGIPIAPTASINTNSTQIATTEYAYGMERAMEIEIFKDATTITASSAVYTMRVPFAMTLTKIPRAYVTTPSSADLVTVDINNGASSIFTTTLSVDANEDTSVTAATPAVLNGTVSVVDDGKLTFDIDSAGTGAAGLKVVLYYRRT